MTIFNAACTSCIVTLQQQREAAIQHQQKSFQTSALQPPKKLHKLCTVVENGKVVIRPVESED